MHQFIHSLIEGNLEIFHVLNLLYPILTNTLNFLLLSVSMVLYFLIRLASNMSLLLYLKSLSGKKYTLGFLFLN